ncbi:hypothetical protein SMACR_06219 [Sordaria macrospora]|uniref:Uncharacterized protein n=1 Tax=Sordaria macrospora TaxID=5147 RepID=A0A8S8ZPR0_SORMA|nr:hypothetical protein SMACR_06219 [Sordaria macrospora]
MSTHQSQPSSPPKRPRLSLQIKTFNGSSVRTSRTLAAAVDVKSPTAFNTLSNVYATAVDRSTPIQEHAPATALSSSSGGRPMLRLQTQAGQDGGAAVVSKDRRLQTPYLGPYLDTPLTAQPMSPAIATAQSQMMFPSAMTATPPLSAQPQEQNGPRVFTFESSNNHNNNNNNMAQQPSLTLNTTTTTTSQASEMPSSSCSETPKRRTTFPSNVTKLPYTHPRSLRSILRNSPLAPLTCQSPNSSRRQSLRLQEKAARRVAYNSPLCETITTSKYTKSHVDLLAEDSGTPTTPTGAKSISSSSEGSSCSGSSSEGEEFLDQTMAYTGNETRDGGQTPGPYEEMRRRMAAWLGSREKEGEEAEVGVDDREGRRGCGARGVREPGGALDGGGTGTVECRGRKKGGGCGGRAGVGDADAAQGQGEDEGANAGAGFVFWTEAGTGAANCCCGRWCCWEQSCGCGGGGDCGITIANTQVACAGAGAAD